MLHDTTHDPTAYVLIADILNAQGRSGADEGNLALILSLGSFFSTIELHPHDKIKPTARVYPI